MKKIFILLITTIGYAYSVNGTITFYDGTSLSGELSSSDTRYIFIIPNGLVMPEKIPVVDIESLNLENGIVLVQDGIAQQTYIDGKFSIVERKIIQESTYQTKPAGCTTLIKPAVCDKRQQNSLSVFDKHQSLSAN